MHKEVVIILWMGVFTFVVGVAYFFHPFFIKNLIGENDPFEKKIFRGNFPAWQFFMISLVFPILALLFITLWDLITSRVSVLIFGVSDKSLLVWIVLLFMYIAYGIGAHAASVSTSHYMRDLTESRAFKVVEFYHHIVSHFMIVLAGIVMLDIFAIVELNHPLGIGMNMLEIAIVLLSALVSGVFLSFLITEGRATYYSFPVLVLSEVFITFQIADTNLLITRYPMVMFTIVTFASMLVTMLFWRIINGEYRETIGIFFHKNPRDS